MDKRILLTIGVFWVIGLGLLFYKKVYGANAAPSDYTKFSCQDTIQAGVPVRFAGHSDDANTWLWNFGDEEVDYGKDVKHTYLLPGTYHVTLTVMGDYGRDTSGLAITVDAAEIAKESDTAYQAIKSPEPPPQRTPKRSGNRSQQDTIEETENNESSKYNRRDRE